MNYQAYYAALSVIVIAFGLSAYAAHRRNKKDSCESVGSALAGAVSKVREAGLRPVTPEDEVAAAFKMQSQGSDTVRVHARSGSGLRMHMQGAQCVSGPSRCSSNGARDKVLAELNRRTENWAAKRQSLNLTNKRQLLIIRELKQLVGADQFSEICRSINALEAGVVLAKAAGK